MEFKQSYSPEQVAQGQLESGQEVVILYIKEFGMQLEAAKGATSFNYNWSYVAEHDAFMLFIYWDNNTEITINFPNQQHAMLEGLKSPKDLIISGILINVLIEQAQASNQDFIDFSGPVAYLSSIIFTDPRETAN
jgi:hypothetical protein